METLFSNTGTEQVNMAQLLGNMSQDSGAAIMPGFMGNAPDILSAMSNIAEGINTPSIDDDTNIETSEETDVTALLAKAEESVAETKPGRPKSDKNAMVSYLNDKITKEEFAVFGDYDDKTPIDEYLASLPEKRLYELFDKNIESAKSSVREAVEKTTQEEFYNNLPYELRQAYEYAANGGSDWGEFYNSIANAQYNYNLDVANDDHQVEIARNYLQATNFGTPEMIEVQVTEWKNEGKIAAKATQFKPMLDGMYQQQVEQINRQQAEYNRQEQQRAQQYIQSVTETLKKGELGGLKIDRKMQSDLYKGLTMVSDEWGNTNELEHLWNQVNFVKPNPEKIAKMLWFMKDEEGFTNALMQKGANKQAENTFNELKKLSVKNNTASSIVELENTNKKPVKKLAPTIGGFFS